MISKDEVEHIAKLARLQLSEKEIEKMQKDLTSILAYFNVLKKAPKLKVDKSNWLIYENKGIRRDEVLPKSSSFASDLIQAAPDKKDGYIKVKSILQ